MAGADSLITKSGATERSIEQSPTHWVGVDYPTTNFEMMERSIAQLVIPRGGVVFPTTKFEPMAGSIEPFLTRLVGAAWLILNTGEQRLTLSSTRTPPALPSAPSQLLATPASLIVSVQAWPLSFIR